MGEVGENREAGLTVRTRREKKRTSYLHCRLLVLLPESVGGLEEK